MIARSHLPAGPCLSPKRRVATGASALRRPPGWLEVSILAAALLGWSAAARGAALEGDAAFLLPRIHGLSGAPTALAISDLDGDGCPDLIVSESSRLEIWWNDGQGDVEATPTLVAPAAARAVAALDVDGDGLPDVVWTDGSGLHRATVRPGRAVGESATLVTGTDLGPLAASDLDRDGRTDLILTRGGALDWMRMGQAGPEAPQLIERVDASATRLTCAGPERDGSIVIALSCGTCGPPATVEVLSLDAAVRVIRSGEIAGGEWHGDVVLADLDRDGWIDVSVSNFSARTIDVYWGKGSGGFTEVDHRFTTASIYDEEVMTVADIDGDGHPDVAVADGADGFGWQNGVMSIHWGDGDRSFRVTEQFRLDQRNDESDLPLVEIAAADLDGDGTSDLVLAFGRRWGEISIVLGAASRRVTLPRVDQYPSGPWKWDNQDRQTSAEVIHPDGKGPDRILLSSPAGTTILALGSDGSLQRSPGPPFHGPLLFADVNGDGRDDAVELNANLVHLALPRGEYAAGEPLPIDNVQCAARIGHDRRMSLVGVDDEGRAEIANRRRDGGFEVQRLPAAYDLSNWRRISHSLRPAVVARPDGRDVPDELVMCGPDSSRGDLELVRLRRDDTGSWRQAQRLLMPGPQGFLRGYHWGLPRGRAMAATDMDGDGRPDVLILALADYTGIVNVFRTMPDGSLSWSDGPTASNDELPPTFTTADCNGDGAPDIVLGAYENGFIPRIRVFFNDGHGNLGPYANLMPGGADFLFVTVADLDGDGAADVIADCTDHPPDAVSTDLTTFFGRGPAPRGRGRQAARPHALAVTPAAPAIVSVTPMPARGAFDVRFAAAGEAPARLELLDVAGRRVTERMVEPSATTTRFELGSGVRPGVYWLRLTQGAHSAVRRVVVIG